jgi:predicted nucleotidyltransferase
VTDEQVTLVQPFHQQAWEITTQRGFRPIYQVVKGSVLYGMPGTHRDVDIRGVYLAPTVDMLAIRKPQHTIEVTDKLLDLVSYEAERFFHHLLKHNGNMIEMLLAPEDLTMAHPVYARPMRQIAERFLTRRLYNYYRGFAMNQFKRSSTQMRTGKGAVYTYREMYAGIMLMRTGRIIYPWMELRAEMENGVFTSKVLDRLSMDRDHMSEYELGEIAREFDTLNDILDKERDRSPLPESYDGYKALNTLLLQWRSSEWR